jgi:hypothetical protein
LELSPAAQANVDQTGVNPERDVDAVRRGDHTRQTLLDQYIDNAEDDRVQGWRDYVDAIFKIVEGKGR